jgi:small conductance mechanosensitive channel
MGRVSMDPTLTIFLANLAYIVLLTVVFLATLGQLGIQTTSLLAIIGAAGLSIGLALKDSLSNFAAGFMLIIFRPFQVGDFIEAGAVSGVVDKIQIFTTQLKTPDNRTVIIPNAKLTSDVITNFTHAGTRRLDLVFGIGYNDDIDQAKSIIQQVLQSESRILAEPTPVIGVLQLGDSSVNIAVRPWVKTADYWSVHFYLLEQMKKQFDAAGITIPFPQRDLHIIENKDVS